MSESSFPASGPIIVKTLEKPFLPGRQFFALYKDHLVIATVRPPLKLPDEILSFSGHTAWRNFSRARKVSVLPFDEIEWIRSYERGIGTDSTVKLTFEREKAKRTSVLLPEKEGTAVLTYLAEKFPDKLDPKIESALDVRRSSRLALVFICLGLDAWIAWALFELWTKGSIRGPQILVDIIWRIYETRGFATTAAITILCTVFANLLLWVITLAVPQARRRTMNCGQCGYSLQGATSDRCPECGQKT